MIALSGDVCGGWSVTAHVGTTAVHYCFSGSSQFRGHQFRVAELELTAADQVDAECDAAGGRRGPGCALVPGPHPGSGGGGDVVGRVFPGIWPGCLGGPGPAWAGDAEDQRGAAVRLGGAQFAAEGDGAAAVVVGFDVLAEEGESGGFGDGRGQDRPPVLGGGGIVEPGALAQEGAAEPPSVQAVGERHVAWLEPTAQGPGRCLLAERGGAGDGEGQAVGEAGGDWPGSAGAGDVYPGGCHSRAQVGDGDAGQGDPGRLQ